MRNPERIYRRSPWAHLPLFLFLLAGCIFLGSVGVKSGSVVDDHAFRIAWRDHTTWLSPSLDSLLEALAKKTSVKESLETQWQSADKLTEDEFDARVRTLCAGDDQFGAIALLRERQGLTLTAAKQRVDEIRRSQNRA